MGLVKRKLNLENVTLIHGTSLSMAQGLLSKDFMDKKDYSLNPRLFALPDYIHFYAISENIENTTLKDKLAVSQKLSRDKFALVHSAAGYASDLSYLAFLDKHLPAQDVEELFYERGIDVFDPNTFRTLYQFRTEKLKDSFSREQFVEIIREASKQKGVLIALNKKALSLPLILGEDPAVVKIPGEIKITTEYVDSIIPLGNIERRALGMLSGYLPMFFIKD